MSNNNLVNKITVGMANKAILSLKKKKEQYELSRQSYIYHIKNFFSELVPANYYVVMPYNWSYYHNEYYIKVRNYFFMKRVSIDINGYNINTRTLDSLKKMYNDREIILREIINKCKQDEKSYD